MQDAIRELSTALIALQSGHKSIARQCCRLAVLMATKANASDEALRTFSTLHDRIKFMAL